VFEQVILNSEECDFRKWHMCAIFWFEVLKMTYEPSVYII